MDLFLNGTLKASRHEWLISNIELFSGSISSFFFGKCCTFDQQLQPAVSLRLVVQSQRTREASPPLKRPNLSTRRCRPDGRIRAWVRLPLAAGPSSVTLKRGKKLSGFKKKTRLYFDSSSEEGQRHGVQRGAPLHARYRPPPSSRRSCSVRG